MPSRRKCAHTTKIERVPLYEAYHGEEDLDDRLGSDGTLDLSIKRVKIECEDPEKVESGGKFGGGAVEEQQRVCGGEDGEGMGVDSGERAMEDEESSRLARECSASPSGELEKGLAETNLEADDTANASTHSRDSACLSAHASSDKVVSAVTDERVIFDADGQALSVATGLPLFPQSTKSRGKSVRPFKLYASQHDLLTGVTTQAAPTLATYAVPGVALAAVPGAVPLAFASLPLVTGAPMIPITASATTSAATSSAAATGAGARLAAAAACQNSSTSSSSSASSSTAKSTSSTTDAHLMTLATEADKILRERHGSGESSTGLSSENIDGLGVENYTSEDDDHEGGVMTITEEGTVLKIPSLSGGKPKGEAATNGDGFSFIQKRAVAAAVAATHPPKNKKKRQTLPDDLKDIAYWERRRKNNEAAKRSRDARRAKEDQIAIRAALLEQENIRLKIEVTALKEETAKLRSRLYTNNNS